MIAPVPRIWLFPRDHRSLEIVILGDPQTIAAMFGAIVGAVASWPGLESPHALVSGSMQLGVVARLSRHATFDDPIAEAQLALDRRIGERVIEWSNSDRAGSVGTWKIPTLTLGTALQ